MILQTLNFIVALAAFVVLVWYTVKTHQIADASVKQIELQTMPIMALFIRKVKWAKSKDPDTNVSRYAITEEREGRIDPSEFYIALNNMGSGPAFNVSVEGPNFIGTYYQTRFFALHGDEHAVKIVRKPNDKTRSLDELMGETFVIRCESYNKKEYLFKYRIIRVQDKRVELISG